MMNMFILLLLVCAGLIAFGFLVDFIYKKKGIVTDPQENEKHVSSSERVYMESMLNTMKEQTKTPPGL